MGRKNRKLSPRALREIFRLPFVRLSAANVAERAYFLWENQTGSRWHDPLSNWLQAELDQMADEVSSRLGSFGLTSPDRGQLDFHECYSLLAADWFPREPRPTPRGSRDPRRCAFCLQT